MTFAAVCPQCESRWKILDEDATGDLSVRCPCCPPPGQLIAQTFEDVCPEQKGRRVTDDRLHLKCCGANAKHECTWAPCPANVDAWTGEELRALAGHDEHRVDDAIAIFTAVCPPVSREGEG